MAFTRSRAQSGFTLIELMITVAIVGILAGVALGQFREYTRRARLSEVILATSSCKTFVSENYLSASSAPPAGGWGCESQVATSVYVGAIKTSANGAARVTIANLEPGINGQFVHLVPVKMDGVTAVSAASDLGRAVPRWLCGSDSQLVRTALPSNCRADTTSYASTAFE
jgi:type IV pilus assembly protein PilA